MDLSHKFEKNYPWLFTKNQDMIIGDDIDAIMSACFLHNFLGWNIIGFYVDYSQLFIKKDCKNYKNAVFVDLDISQNDIKSIGHHILQLDGEELSSIGHLNSVNPNLLRNISMKNFNQKYPLATIHFLQWIYSYHIDVDSDLKNILWFPDSSWINGQSHRYRKNMSDWIYFFDLKNLKESFNEINKKSFEEIIKNRIIPLIYKNGFSEGRSQISSMNYNIRGFQCQFKNPMYDMDKIYGLIDMICSIFEWDKPSLPTKYAKIKAKRNSIDIRDYNIDTLSNFIYDKNIFSYVIPNYNRINYTVM